ncbi:general secretion pathway protein GspN [Bradyrhizobium sp. STM 3809]|uniref:general secretion pathway protein GspN n=1 Tax=Bradyrhizobium sp. STM 3809 TaxID=551936 RepID=UPI0002F56CA9|nr:general secretion pathway protein GspN [Bradyrhizobium sp. STM 3809]
MRSFLSSRAIALVLAGLLSGSAGLAWSGQGDPPELVAPAREDSGSQPASRAAVAESAARSINPLWAIPLDTLAATRDRPIFSPSRRPPPAIAAPVIATREPPPPPPREPERPTLQLVGTVVSDDESFGIFLDPSSQASLRLRLGAEHEGWLLQSVKSRQVTLRKDGETVTLPMPQPGDGDLQTAGVAPAPPAARERMARRAR